MIKRLAVITGTTIRHIVAAANNMEVQKEDIVDIKKLSDNEYALIYYAYEKPE